MTPEEFQEWLDSNPEAKELFEQAMATSTALAQPTVTPTTVPTATLSSALPAGDSSSACKLVAPPEGAELEHLGKVNFEWEPQPGATKYVLTFVTSNGNTVSFETTETSIEKYIEIFPVQGQYQWSVSAFSEGGDELCKSETVSFSKPDSEWEPPKIEEEEITPVPTSCGYC